MKFFTKAVNQFGSREMATSATIGTLVVLDLLGGSGVFTSIGLTIGSNPKLGGALCEALKGALPAYLQTLFDKVISGRKIEKNHTNSILFINSLERCLREVEARLAEEYEIPETKGYEIEINKNTRKTIKEKIIGPVFQYFNQERIEGLFDELEHLQPGKFIEFAFDRSVDFTSKDLIPFDEDKDKIRATFCATFRGFFNSQIRKEISKDPILRDSYFTFLKHQMVGALESIESNMLTEGKFDEVVLDLKTLSQHTHTKIDSASLVIQERIGLLEETLQRQYSTIKAFYDKAALPGLIQFKNTPVANQEAELSFSYQQTTFVGRREIKNSLYEFMEGPEAFQWLMVSGEAGQGKSRLALQLCDDYTERGWYCGFYVERHGVVYDWSNLKPLLVREQQEPSAINLDSGILIVIDEAGTLGESKVEDILQGIADQMRQLEGNAGKVRVILLERFFTKEWLDKIDAVLDHVKEHYFGKRYIPISIVSLDKEDLLSIIKEVSRIPFTNKDEENIYDKLCEIDGSRRPLIAFIIGLYLQEFGFDGSLQTWNKISDPIKTIFIREEHRFWQHSRFWQEDSLMARDCLFFSALVERSNWDDLFSIMAEMDDSYSSAKRKQFVTVKDFYQRISLYKGHEFLGYKPDLAAEYYIVNHLLPKPPMDKEVGFKLLALALHHDPDATQNMLGKTEQNFGDHPGFQVVREWIAQEVVDVAPNETAHALTLARICSTLSQNHINKKLEKFDLEALQFYFSHILSLQSRFPGEIEIARIQGRLAVAFTYYYLSGEEVDLEEARISFYKHLVALREIDGFETDENLAISQARGARNLIYSYCFLEPVLDIEASINIFHKNIIDLRNTPGLGDLADVGSMQVISAYNIISYYLSKPIGNGEKGLQFYQDHVQHLSNIPVFMEDKDLVYWYTQSSLKLIEYFALPNSLNVNNATNFLAQISSIRQAHFAKDDLIALVEAKGIMAIIRMYKRFSNTQKDRLMHARSLLLVLDDFRSEFPDSASIGKIRSDMQRDVNEISFDMALENIEITQQTFPDEQIMHYTPFCRVTCRELDQNEISEVLRDAWIYLNTDEEIYFKSILGGRAFIMPFHEETTLYEILCEQRGYHSEQDIGQKLGYFTFIHNPGENALPFFRLSGKSKPIHQFNADHGIDLNSEENALEYLHFFCSFVHGEEGAFHIVEDARDLFLINRETDTKQLPGLDKILAETKETPIRREGNQWHIQKLLAYSDALFLADFRVNADTGLIEMLDDNPKFQSVNQYSLSYEEGLKCLKIISSEEIEPSE